MSLSTTLNMEVMMKFLRLLPFFAVVMTACDTRPVTEIPVGPADLRLQHFVSDTPTVGTTYNVWATVEDSHGRGLPATRIHLDTDSLSGHTPAFVVTNSDGRALVQWVLDIQAGPQVLRAQVEGLDAVAVRLPTKAGPVTEFEVQSDTILLTSYEQSAKVQVRGFDEFGNARDGDGVNWLSRNARIASVDPDGVVTPVSFGKVWVVGSLPNGVRDSVLVEVATPLQ